MIVGNVFQIFSSLWLSSWSDDGLDPSKVNDTALRNLRLGGYAGFGTGVIISNLFSTIALNIACIRAAKILHNDMLNKIMFAPMSFFGKFKKKLIFYTNYLTKQTRHQLGEF